MDSHVLLESAAWSSVASVRPETAGVSFPTPSPPPPSLWSQCPEQVICKSEHRPVKKISADHLNAGRDVLNTQLDRFSSSWRNSVPNGHRECYSPLPSSSGHQHSSLRWPQTARKWRFLLRMMVAPHHRALSTRPLTRRSGIAGKRRMTPCVVTACPSTCTTRWGASSLPATCTWWRRFLWVRRRATHRSNPHPSVAVERSGFTTFSWSLTPLRATHAAGFACWVRITSHCSRGFEMCSAANFTLVISLVKVTHSL